MCVKAESHVHPRGRGTAQQSATRTEDDGNVHTGGMGTEGVRPAGATPPPQRREGQRRKRERERPTVGNRAAIESSATPPRRPLALRPASSRAAPEEEAEDAVVWDSPVL